jgi:hypothetical protein
MNHKTITRMGDPSVHTSGHPGRSIRQFVTMAAALVAAPLVASVLALTLSVQGGRGVAEAQPPNVETPQARTVGERTAAYQRHLDRLQELNTTPQARTVGGRTAAYQRHLDRLQELNTTPQAKTADDRR